ncbi:MAG: 23S rRNA (pseudouridine(1915)-N(3))-methyltransferase RlmH [Clostridia bacterium]|nr:23S rRNA (pseudouridine(1915)-N(3))-methyltransferase RlmH [Clostridia bacterium]
MKIRILCTGRLKERFYTEAAAEFSKRLSRFCEFEILELPDEKVPDDPSPAQIEAVKRTECRRMEEKLGAGEYVIALDPRGKQLSSEELSEAFSDAMLRGRSRITLLIGGSHGLTQEIRGRADLVLSFSRMTFSHQIFRIMLLEQIYRAFKIMNGEPYHK